MGQGAPPPGRGEEGPAARPHRQAAAGRMTDAPLATPQATPRAPRATGYWDGCRGPQIRLAGCEKSQLFCLMPSICDGGDRY